MENVALKSCNSRVNRCYLERALNDDVAEESGADAQAE